MRYIGGKSRLAPQILDLVFLKNPRASDLTDLFSGSGAVAAYAKTRGLAVTTNDIMYFSYVLARGSIALNSVPTFKKLTRQIGLPPLDYFHRAGVPQPLPGQLIRESYSPDSVPARMYLTVANASRVDFARVSVEDWLLKGWISDDEYFYLLAGLLGGIPKISNITGTYGAFLKHWDKRALSQFEILPSEVVGNKHINRSYNEDGVSLLSKISGGVLYLDPPYNERQYLPNYHLLETVAKYDFPTLSGITGQRDGSAEKSLFCSKKTAVGALEGILAAAKFEHVILSYSSDGVMSSEEIKSVLSKFAVPGSLTLDQITYRRYKSKIPNASTGLVEQLYYIRKK